MQKTSIEAEEAEKALFKKKVKMLSEFHGSNTELISLYIPENADRSTVIGQLTAEISQSSNIKDPKTRKNVQGALRRIINLLKQIDFRIPKNGLVVFAGNISSTPGISDIKLFTIRPIKNLTVKLYWCDSTFHLDPLIEMLEPESYYGIITLDKNESTLAILYGKKYDVVGHFTSRVPGKIRAGGQCLSPDSLVVLSDGRITEISKIYSHLPVKSVDFNDYSFIDSEVKAKWNSRNKSAIKIITKSPRLEIVCSEEHTFFIANNGTIKEMPASNLKEGFLLLMPERIEIKGKKQELLNKKLAEVIGYLIVKDSIKKERITFFDNDRQLIEAYTKNAAKLFNANYSITFRKSMHCFQASIHGKTITRFIEAEFPEIKKAVNAFIPEKVLLSKNNVLAAFLRGLFDAKAIVSRKGLSLSLNNKKLIQQLQLALLRFSIISSVSENNKKMFSSSKHEFTININEKESLELFQKHINFNSVKKTRKLKEVIDKKYGKSNVRILSPKTKIKKMLEAKELKKKFTEIKNSPLLPIKISRIERLKNSKSMVDLEVSKKNFIANGFIVHNSAQRFARLREEAEHDFYKEVSTKANAAFLPVADKLKGIIVSGPGLTKQDFLSADLLDYRLKQKVLGTIDTSYTDASGIRETINKATDLLKNTEIMHEKGLLQKFFAEVARNALATYGLKETREALKHGKVSELILSEAIEKAIYKFKCLNCNEEIELIEDMKKRVDESSISCNKCNGKTELVEEADFIEVLTEEATKISAKTTIVSIDTEEGKQFLESFGGIGALLRFK